MPSTSTLPEVGASRKLMHRSSVLLPEPERPKITTHSPSPTSRFTPFKTSFSPNTLRTSRSLTTGRTPAFSLLVSMRTTVPHVAFRESPLESCLGVREEVRERPVDKGCDHQRLQVLEVLAPDLRRAEEQFLGADDTNERRVLDHGCELVARRRDDHPDRLGQHDPAHGLRPRHAQCMRSLGLPVPYRLDASAEDLRHVSPVVDAERQDPRGDGPQNKESLQPPRRVLGELREPEVDKEDLDDQGRPADKGDIEPADPVEHGIPGEPS